jgi:hypothetical protein
MVIVSPRSAVDRLAAADFAVTLQRQPELKAATAEQLQRISKDTKSLAASRVTRLRHVHFTALILVISAGLTAVLLNRLLPIVPPEGRTVSAIISIGAFSWATLARLGWAGQSIKGDTAIERVDESWFRLLYWVATLLGMASLA